MSGQFKFALRIAVYGLLALLLLHYGARAWLGSGPYNGFDVSNIKVPIEQLVSGGPPRDGIPSIDDPNMIRADEVGFLDPGDRVLGFSGAAGPRAYPIRILNWHEIVNDRTDSGPLLVTWCPLCGTGAVFAPPESSGGFGVSGLLYQSDLVLYDRDSESLWPQVSGQAISGPKVGQALRRLPVEHTTWGDWRQRHPQTLVLSDATGFVRDYDRNPYAAYVADDGLMFDVSKLDRRYPVKTTVIGLELNGDARVWPFPELARSSSPLRDRLGGRELRVHYDQEHGNAWIETTDGERMPALTGFWFAWMAFHPGSTVYRAVTFGQRDTAAAHPRLQGDRSPAN